MVPESRQYPFMPLIHSHIRFAVDICESLGVGDKEKYISGIMYPDSGYISGLDKKVTHPGNFLEDPIFQKDDFHKGCFAHILYDRLFDMVARKEFPELFRTEWDGQRKGSELWAGRTALKILQDIEDAQVVDIKTYLPYLVYANNPSGEPLEDVREYNSILQKVFSEPEELYEKYYHMWTLLGVEDYKVEMIRRFVKEYRQSSEFMTIVREMYANTFSTWKQNYASLA